MSEKVYKVLDRDGSVLGRIRGETGIIPQSRTPRLRILELPTEHDGDKMTTPFVFVIDRADEETLGMDVPGTSNNICELSGARAVLVFKESIDIE